MSCWVRGPYSAFSLSSDSACFKRVSVRRKVVEEGGGGGGEEQEGEEGGGGGEEW